MKTPLGTNKLITLVGMVPLLMCLLIACEKARPPDTNAILLTIGEEGNKKRLDRRFETLKAAWEEVHSPAKEHRFYSREEDSHNDTIGGTMTGPTPSGGVHSTQRITFRTPEDLEAFSKVLKAGP